jgi:uroporphyrinogen decarboxylase
MTPRERVLTALRHKEPDRVPFDLGASILTGITTTAYKRLRAFMGLPPSRELRIMDIVQQLAFVDEDAARKLQTDVRGIFLKDPSDWSLKITDAGKYFRFTDQWGIGWQMPKEGGYYYDMWKSSRTNNPSADNIYNEGAGENRRCP